MYPGKVRRFREELLFADLEIVTGRVEKLRDRMKKPRPAKERDAEQAELSSGLGVRAAAKLHRIAVKRGRLAADLHDAHNVPVLLSEKLHDVLARLHLSIRSLGPTHSGVFQYAFVDEFLNIGHLLRRQRRAAEIEREFIRANVRPFLGGVSAHDFVQGPVE